MKSAYSITVIGASLGPRTIANSNENSGSLGSGFGITGGSVFGGTATVGVAAGRGVARGVAAVLGRVVFGDGDALGCALVAGAFLGEVDCGAARDATARAPNAVAKRRERVGFIDAKLIEETGRPQCTT